MQLIGKYSKWVTLVASLLLVASCFMAWAYFPDLNKSFTGWFTERNVYGKPGKWLSFMAIFSIIAQFSPSIFLKRANLLMMALNVAYAFFTFVKYTRSYGIINPNPQPGIYLMLGCSILMLIAALFPSGELKKEKGIDPSMP